MNQKEDLYILLETLWDLINPEGIKIICCGGSDVLKAFTVEYFKSKHDVFLQFIRFGLVGIISTLTHMGTLIFLVELLEFNPIIASTVGFILAVIISYFLNYRFTFRVHGGHFHHFPRYAVVCIVGFSLNTGIMFLTVNILKWWYVAGQICTLLVVPVSNFTLNKFWTFKDM